MESLKVGIIGVGNIGTAHANCIYNGKVKNCVLTALCDISDEKVQYLKEKFPDVKVYRDSDELIKSGNVDAVIVSTPHKFHSDIAISALNTGLHVLVEKPVDISVTKAYELNEVWKSSGKVFAVMFNQRTNPLFKKARDIVKSGGIGELKRTNWIVTNWYRTQNYYDSGDWRATWKGEGGGVLINQAPHNLDLWQWICGMPCEITAFCDTAKYHRIEVEDDVTIFARYKNGATGTFITTTGEYMGTNRLEISGDKGKIIIENGTLKFWKFAESERKYCFDENADSRIIDFEYTEEKQTSEGTAHTGILQNFCNAVLFGEELISNGCEAVNELLISNAAYLSEWKGNAPVKLPFDADEFDRLLNEHIKNSEIKSKKTVSKTSANTYSKRWEIRW